MAMGSPAAANACKFCGFPDPIIPIGMTLLLLLIDLLLDAHQQGIDLAPRLLREALRDVVELAREEFQVKMFAHSLETRREATQQAKPAATRLTRPETGGQLAAARMKSTRAAMRKAIEIIGRPLCCLSSGCPGCQWYSPGPCWLPFLSAASSR